MSFLSTADAKKVDKMVTFPTASKWLARNSAKIEREKNHLTTSMTWLLTSNFTFAFL